MQAHLQFFCQTGQPLCCVVLSLVQWVSTRLSPCSGVALVLNKAAISVSRTCLKAILEPERVYFNTFLDKERRREDAVKNGKRKL